MDWLVVFEFELGRGKASEGGVAALAVVEDFDEVEDLGFGVGAAGEPGAVDQLQLEGAPEALHRGVVVAVAPAAHRGDQTTGLEGGAEVAGGVLDTPVGVEEQSGRGLAVGSAFALLFQPLVLNTTYIYAYIMHKYIHICMYRNSKYPRL